MNETVQSALILIPILLLSMSLHEMMHAFTADWLGDPTARLMGRVSLNPLRHIDPFFTVALPLILLLAKAPPFGAAKPVQVNFNRLKYGDFGGAIVGVIGPLTNLAIAVVASIFFKHLNLAYGGLAYDIVGITILINVGFFLFNIIPWPPLDGSRLLFAFAPEPLRNVMISIERAGITGLLILVLLFYTVFSVPFSNILASMMGHLAPGFLQSLGLL